MGRENPPPPSLPPVASKTEGFSPEWWPLKQLGLRRGQRVKTVTNQTLQSRTLSQGGGRGVSPDHWKCLFLREGPGSLPGLQGPSWPAPCLFLMLSCYFHYTPVTPNIHTGPQSINTPPLCSSPQHYVFSSCLSGKLTFILRGPTQMPSLLSQKAFHRPQS